MPFSFLFWCIFSHRTDSQCFLVFSALILFYPLSGKISTYSVPSPLYLRLAAFYPKVPLLYPSLSRCCRQSSPAFSRQFSVFWPLSEKEKRRFLSKILPFFRKQEDFFFLHFLNKRKNTFPKNVRFIIGIAPFFLSDFRQKSLKRTILLWVESYFFPFLPSV